MVEQGGEHFVQFGRLAEFDHVDDVSFVLACDLEGGWTLVGLPFVDLRAPFGVNSDEALTFQIFKL